jgi:hypothetical protein
LRRLGGWVGLALVPAGAWYVYGRYVSGFLVAQDDGRVSPKLLWTVAFWEGWAKRAADVLPVPRPAALVLWVLLALAVALSLRRAERWTQLLLGSLVAGYVLFGLVFTVHYSTHDYYHLPLVGLLALALGVVWSRIVGRIQRPAAALLATGGVAAALALPILWERSSFRPSEQEVRQRVYRSEAIGRLLDHSTAVGFIADDFGLSLTYFGDVSGTLWDPRPNEPPSATFERLFGGGAVDYVVVTDTRLEDFSAVELLIDGEYPVLAGGADWVVYDLRSP